MHGGTISAYSAGEGQGSEFVVRLPVVSDGANDSETSSQRAVAVAPRQTNSRRILIVDDNHDSAESLGLLMRLMGHEVRTIYDGIKALEIAKEFRPRVVLLDIGLPGISGYEVAHKLREEAAGERPVVIAI